MAYAWKSHTNLRRVYNRVTIAICDLVPSYITVQHTNKEVDNLEQAKEEEEEWAQCKAETDNSKGIWYFLDIREVFKRDIILTGKVVGPEEGTNHYKVINRE